MPPAFDALQGQRMGESAIDQLLTAEGVGVLSMAAEGEPYGIPLSFGYDAEVGRCYVVFAGHSEAGRKVTFAERTDTASLLAYDLASAERWRSAIVAGPFERIDPEEWDRAREAMAENAFRPELLTEVDVRANPRVWGLDVAERSGRAVGEW